MPCVNIREDLYKRAEEYVKTSGAFSNVEELLNFMLGELLSEGSGQGLSKQDEEEIKQRLRALGYI